MMNDPTAPESILKQQPLTPDGIKNQLAIELLISRKVLRVHYYKVSDGFIVYLLDNRSDRVIIGTTESADTVIATLTEVRDHWDKLVEMCQQMFG